MAMPVNIYKTEMMQDGIFSFRGYRPAWKALLRIANAYGEDTVISDVLECDMRSLAYEMMDMDGYDGPADLEDAVNYIVENAVFEFEVTDGRKTGTVLYSGDDMFIAGGPVFGDRQADEQVVARFIDQLREWEGFDDENYLSWNLVKFSMENAAGGKFPALFKVGTRIKPEPIPLPMPAPAPDGGWDGQPVPFSTPASPDAADERVIIRERVIEKEKEPVLEGLLRQALMEQLVKLNLDEVHETVKKRLIEDFGFEPVRHVVHIHEKEHDVEGAVVHRKFDTVLHYVANNIPVYMFGAAGSGKNVLCEQVAHSLGLDFYFMNSVTDEFKIQGFMDAHGTYHETEFYKAFKNGGLFFLDELDASSPDVLVCLNAAIANGYFAFPNGRVNAHPDFRCIAAGNTLGTGADSMYTGRMQLDAASLNRFVVVEVDYDKNIDKLCADDDMELVEFIEKFRETAKNLGLPVVASYRNIMQIVIAKEAVPVEEALAQCLCKEMNQDDINMMAEHIKLNTNKYANALAKVRSMVG